MTETWLRPYRGRASVSLFLTILGAVGLASSAAAQDQRLSPELLWKLARVGDPQIGPAGKRVVYSVRKYELAANKGQSQLWLFERGGGKPRQLTKEGSNWHARWSKVGDAVAFLSTRSGKPQIHVVKIATGEVRQVTEHPGGVANLVWSPDGSMFAFTADVRTEPSRQAMFPDLPKATAHIYDDLMVRHWDHWKDGTHSHLFVVPAKGGEPTDLMRGMKVDTPLKPFGGAEQIAFSPDGSEVCYTAKQDPNPEISTNSDLFVVSVKGGKHRNLTKGMVGYDMEPAYSPDGSQIAFASMARAGFESDRSRIMIYDKKTELIRELSSGWDMAAQGLVWAASGKQLYFTVDKKGERHVFRLTLGAPQPVQMTRGRYYFGAVNPSPDGSIFCLRQQTERPNELVHVAGGKPGTGTPVTDHNGAIYEALALPKIRERWTTATDGKKIHSWVIYPPDFGKDPNKKWPMLLYCQGGPQSQVGQWFSYRWNFHLMAAHGYVVVAVNRRGLPGFGRAWNDEISRDWGGQAMRDLLSACDDVRNEPYINKARVGAIGASFGGYTIYWLMGNDDKDRFSGMISHCGVFNLESMYLATEEQFFVNWDLGGPFWRSKKVQRDYDRFSPHRFIGRWKTPLLVIHGQKDYRVPLTEGLQAFTAAQLQGVPSRFLYFPDEGHWVLSPQNGVLWHRVFFDWLDRHVKSKSHGVSPKSGK